jgi:peptidoglycan hydrolase CwlO-like protein
MSTHNNNPQSGDVDARLQFLLHSTESLHSTVHEHSAQIAENGKQIAENGKQIAENGKQIAENGKQIAELRKTASDLATATGALLLISQSHKERLDRLDGGNKQ